MAEQTIKELNILDRTTFDNLSDTQKNGNIYFVREGTSETETMLSLYFENIKQCDILDISDSFTYVSTIPDKYKVKGKILLAKKQEDIFYQALMWDGDEFVNCLGIPNNLIVCEGLPNIFTAVKNYVYLDLLSNGIYVFNGYGYENLISSTTYATNQYLNQVYNNLIDMINNISASGGGIIGNSSAVQRGTMLTHVGSLEYPLLQGILEPLVNGGWYWDAQSVLSFNLQTPPSNRVGLTRLYELPAGKSALISATSEGKQIFVRYSANGIIGNSSTDSGWQNLPYTITNSGAGSLYIGMQFRDPTDANITPEDIGTVTAVME